MSKPLREHFGDMDSDTMLSDGGTTQSAECWIDSLPDDETLDEEYAETHLGLHKLKPDGYFDAQLPDYRFVQ